MPGESGCGVVALVTAWHGPPIAPTGDAQALAALARATAAADRIYTMFDATRDGHLRAGQVLAHNLVDHPSVWALGVAGPDAVCRETALQWLRALSRSAQLGGAARAR